MKKAGGTTLSDLELHHQTLVTKKNVVLPQNAVQTNGTK
jgi:hypothetical protein